MAYHCTLTGEDIHVINTWTYANSAARAAATGFTADDVYKVAVQEDDYSIWILVDNSPITWMQLGGVVVSTINHCDLNNLLVDCHTQYMPTDASRAFTQPVSGQDPTLDNHLTTKVYTDTQDAAVFAAANSYSDAGDTATLSAANSYSDAASANALAQANTYSDSVSAAAQEFENYVTQMWDDENEPTGFVNRTDSTLSFDDGTRTLTISGASYDFYIDGVKFTKTGSSNKQITDTEGLWWFYFDSNGTLQATQTFATSLILNNALVAIVYWDATNNSAIYFGDERHGITMDGITHAYLHLVFGTKWISGLGLANFDIDGDGNSDSHAQFSVVDGVIYDEDLRHSIENGNLQTLAPTAYIPVYYLDGASAYWRKDTATAFPVKSFSGGSGRLAWNEFTGGAWQQTEVSNLQFVLCHIFATNDINEPVISIQGQATYNSIAAAREGATTEINSLVTGDMPFVEFVALGTVIYQTRDTYTNSVKARTRTTDEGADYIDFRTSNIAGGSASTSDHGSLSGLLDDDHPQYMPVNASRAFTAPVSGVDPTLDNHLATKLYTDTASANALSQAEDYADAGDVATLAAANMYSDLASANALTQALAADIDTFIGLTDTPSGYSGKGLQLVRVNVGETGLEFVPSGGGTSDAVDNDYENTESEGESSTSSTTFQQKLRLTTSVLPSGNYMLQWYAEGRHSDIGDAIEMQIEEDDTTVHGLVRFYSGDSGGTNWIQDFQPFSGHRILEDFSGSHTFDIDYRAVGGGTSAEIRRARITIWRMN